MKERRVGGGRVRERRVSEEEVSERRERGGRVRGSKTRTNIEKEVKSRSKSIKERMQS